MKITIHRGLNQIGGCITEIQSLSGTKILIDLGHNLPDGGGVSEDKYESPENLDQLLDGCSAVFYTHYHGDHLGFAAEIHERGVTQYMGPLAIKIMIHLNDHMVYAEKLKDRAQANLKALNEFKTFAIRRKTIIGDIAIIPFASVWTKDFDLRDLIQEFNEEPSIKIFGGLQSETFTQSLSLNALGNCQKTNQLNLTTANCQAVWDRTLDCLRLAIDLISDYGAVKNDILPYESVIPVIQYYYFKSGKNNIENAHKLLIDDWYWTTIFSRRYSSSTLTRMKEDADWIDRVINGNNESRVFAITLTCQDLRRINMKNKSVIKDGILCILAANNPVDFNNGQGVKLDKTNASRANAKENHHFFPYSRHKDFGITQDAANSLLNFAFISKTLNIAISNKLPSEYLSEYAKENPKLSQCLATHFIDIEAYTFAVQNDFNSFAEARGKSILAKINSLCKVNVVSETIFDITEEEFDSSDDLSNEEVMA